MSVNLTEEERARLRGFLEQVRDAMLLTNMRGDLIFFNAAAGTILGVPPGEARLEGSLLFAPRDPERWRMSVQDILKMHTLRRPYEISTASGRASGWEIEVRMFDQAPGNDLAVLVLLRPSRG